ncbi:SWIM zinc finger family protein [Mucilaginibacter ginsenosidivorax]|uniref:SWIM zinc finger family protein n=1 Tax=Mucilaginibacter ginsenosidivorax TaxID=862126 RepID=A0A5B8W701_9SPHI|nr:SWIM zinc finger family protein [Mucilaginibacter ginsenosidivorax]QEC78705.1 SWIM zinc finger family protein [Mucilaginibacter ginsenosidivorax]
MSETITYQYSQPSTLKKSTLTDELFLAKYSEVQKNNAPCFFWGQLTDPYTVARCLLTLSNVVKSSFSLSPFELAMLKDPIVTAGNEKIRFEGFSHCAGVYARVDILGDGHDGEFLDNGTTNVDFNQPMLAALSNIRRSEKVLLSVGRKEVALHREGEKVVERKVPLPTKWIKGLTSVQMFLAGSEKVHSFNRLQALQLFKTIPLGKPKTDYYLITRGGKPMFSPVKSGDAITVGGVHRLKLIEPLLAIADELRVFPHATMQSTTWQIYIGPVRFSLSISRDAWRGFSGEGAALESLIEDVPDNWVESLDNYSYANQEFNPTLLAVNEGLDMQKVDNITGRLSAIGLLGYDLDENNFFYRRLPFKLSRIMSLNPRLKDAEKLLQEGKVQITKQQDDKVEARVEGSGVHHMVVLNGDKAQCTCTWFSKNQGERGICKHILAVKKKLAN